MLKKRCESRKSLSFFRKTVNDLLNAKKSRNLIRTSYDLTRKRRLKGSRMSQQATEDKKSNRKLLWLFLLGVLIALLPWFVLAAS
jgi:hypothetical protein